MGSSMQVVHTIADLRDLLSGHRDINFVPTMGNLHAGHLSLVDLARRHPGLVVASIFVNPLQFAPHEDFGAYPRTLQRDCELLASSGCDIVFAPSAQGMYPEEQVYTVHPPAALADILEGDCRPGFFVGVCTVVMKLFSIVQPSVAVFGKKDYQQLLVIRDMVRQFAAPIEIVAAETVRDASGLALSSRNGYLDAVQRVEAAQLRRVLLEVANDVQSGRADFAVLEVEAMQHLERRGWTPDYVAVRRRRDLGHASPGEASSRESLVVLGAAKLGATRLIDNVEMTESGIP